jgi:hypothetical protein
MLDDALGDFLLGDRADRIGLALRLGIDPHIEEGDGPSPSLPVLAG